MKKLCYLTLAVTWLTLSHGPSVQAVSLEFISTSQVVDIGTLTEVEIVISGLGDFITPALGAYSFDVTFDSSILSFNSVQFGDPVLGDLVDVSGLASLLGFRGFNVGAGMVSLFETSFDSLLTLISVQPASFTLATLTFDTIGGGTSILGFNNVVLGDEFGIPLVVEVRSGSLSAVPEPTTLLLLSTGLASLIGLTRKVGV